MSTMSQWRVGLSSWIIQDGNYGDFQRGQQAAFALEFFPHDCRPSSAKECRARRTGENRYSVTAKVLHVSRRACVIDFGVRAFRQGSWPKILKKGAWIDADLYLGIDPFFYFEELANARGMPPLIYDWTIRAITMQTAPFLESRTDRGQRLFIRDESKSAFKRVQQTAAWTDDNGHAEYVLHCQVHDRRPRRTLDRRR
jgi:hypothetical protein